MSGPAATGVARLTEHLFRHEAERMVSVLTGIFGLDRLQMAEDVVQEALVRALQTWPYDGIPEKPAAWLMQTARNRALDLIRREKNFHAKQTEVITAIEQRLNEPAAEETARFDDEIKDGRLRLIFACCHPALPPESQTALALKTLCGLSPAEIARAFLTTEAAVTKRLTRARQAIQEAGLAFEIPVAEELAARLEAVRQVLYLLFNEGYKASGGEHLVRPDLCAEAIRLTAALVEHPSANRPATHALLALMLFNAARFAGRIDAAGNILRLQDQDRTTWDRDLIARGIAHLRSATAGNELSEYHLQAGIAACHCTAADDASTDWPMILAQYDQWQKISPSPVVALNRAVALAKVAGPAAGLDALALIPGRRTLDSYYLTHAVLGEFEAQLGRHPAAAAHFRRALELTALRSERIFLEKKLRACLAA